MTNVDISNQRRDILVGAGSVLFGHEWQRAIARTLGRWHPDGARPSIDDRLVRRWATGERAIPSWVLGALASIFEAQRRELDTFLIRLRRPNVKNQWVASPSRMPRPIIWSIGSAQSTSRNSEKSRS